MLEHFRISSKFACDFQVWEPVSSLAEDSVLETGVTQTSSCRSPDNPTGRPPGSLGNQWVRTGEALPRLGFKSAGLMRTFSSPKELQNGRLSEIGFIAIILLFKLLETRIPPTKLEIF